MEDLRKKSKMSIKGHYITAGYNVDENSVKEMLTFMGVPHDDTLVHEAIGYFSSNSIEFNMNSLADYLKTKQVISKKDVRKKK